MSSARIVVQVDSKTKEIETEDHLKLIDERELGRVGLEIAELEKEEIELQDKLNSVQVRPLTFNPIYSSTCGEAHRLLSFALSS